MFAILVEVPVFLAGDIRVVRMGKADGQTPRAGVMAARQVIELAGRVIGDLIVVFHLVRNFRDASTSDRPHIVVPPVDPLAWFAVIWGPAEIRRVNVCGQTLFKPMQLIRANKVHFARQTGLVASTA